MPTVNIDVTDQFANLYDNFIKQANWGGDLNPGQIATLNNLEPTITATAQVRIAGLDVDVTVDVDVDFGSYPEYVSQTVDKISQTFDLYSAKLESGRGWDAGEIIKEAFAEL